MSVVQSDCSVQCSVHVRGKRATSCRALTTRPTGAIPVRMARSDLEIANDFVRRWGALSKQRRARRGGEIPVAALQAAALSHPDFALRRFCLFLLDHYASPTFRTLKTQ